MKRRIWILPATIAALFLVAIPPVSAAEFYKGKTITFVVGFSAGGGFDTYTRLIAKDFAKHVPGNPTVVVQNKTGAGSLIAANYIYNQAPRDGTVIGNWVSPLVLQQIMGNKAAQFNGRKFGWLGVPTSDSFVCVMNKKSGIKTMDDWMKSKRPIKIGAGAPGSDTDDVSGFSKLRPELLRNSLRATAAPPRFGSRLSWERSMVHARLGNRSNQRGQRRLSRVMCTSSCSRLGSPCRTLKMCPWQSIM